MTDPHAPRRAPLRELGSPEDQSFADGIIDEMRGDLFALARLQVIARGSSTPYKDTAKPPQQIAQELGVEARLRWSSSSGLNFAPPDARTGGRIWLRRRTRPLGLQYHIVRLNHVFGEILTTSEVEYCRAICDELRGVPWVAPLITRLDGERWCYQTKPLLFELRVAAEIHRAGLTAHYEYSTGIGSSSVDFRFEHDGCEWLVELVSILVSDAVKAASWENGMMFGTDLSSDAADPRQSPGAELIVAQQKIGEKVWDGETWVKFPPPASGRYHVVLADMRGMAITCGDIGDYAQLAYGPQALASVDVPLALRFNGELVRGLFEPTNNRLRSAVAVRQRIHFLGFCKDEVYEPGSLVRASTYFRNPHLLPQDEAVAVLRHLPLLSLTSRVV